MESEPKLLEAFLQFTDVRELDRPTQAAVRLCNHHSKKVIDATVAWCKVDSADVALLCGCDWRLKELTIEGTWNTKSLVAEVLPNALFQKFSLLETLKIQGCLQLEALPENIGNLMYLRDIQIHAADKFTTFPPSLGQLTALELFCCRALTLDKGLAPLKQLHQLKMLDMGGWYPKENPLLQEWICDNITTGLLDLRLRDALGPLPSTISNFKHLTRLILDGSSRYGLPDSIGSLSSLQTLAILEPSDSEPIGLPDSFSMLSALKELDLTADLDWIEPLQSLTGLTKLNLLFCSICHFEGTFRGENFFLNFFLLERVLWTLTSLKSLRLFDNTDTAPVIELDYELSNNIGKLKNLESLYLHGVEYLHKLPDTIGTLSCLTELDIGSIQVERLPDSIGSLKRLKILNIRYCFYLHTLPSSIGDLHALEELRLTKCSVRKLPAALVKLDALKTLSLIDCEELNVIHEAFADRVLGINYKKWSLEQVIINDCDKLVVSPKMEQAMDLLRRRGALIEERVAYKHPLRDYEKIGGKLF
jgi:hypothetical protein